MTEIMDGYFSMCGSFTKEDFFTFFADKDTELVEGIVCAMPGNGGEDRERMLATVEKDVRMRYPEDKYDIRRGTHIIFDYFNVVRPAITVVERRRPDDEEVTWGLPCLVVETEFSPIKLNLYKVFGVEEYWAFDRSGELTKHRLA